MPENLTQDASTELEQQPVETPEVEQPTEQQPELEGNDGPDPDSAASEGEPAADPKTQQAAEKPPVKETPAEKRIRQLVAENKRLKQQSQPAPQQQNAPQKKELPVEPKWEDFVEKGYDAFEAANRKFMREYADVTAHNAIIEDRVQQHRQRQEQEANEQSAATKTAWEKRVQQTLKRNADFDVAEAVQLVQPNPATDGFLLDSEIGPDLLDHLAKNPDEAERIRELGPYQAVRALTKLEAQIQESFKAPKPKPQSKPPAYVQGGSAPVKQRYLENILYGDD